MLGISLFDVIVISCSPEALLSSVPSDDSSLLPSPDSDDVSLSPAARGKYENKHQAEKHQQMFSQSDSPYSLNFLKIITF